MVFIWNLEYKEDMVLLIKCWSHNLIHEKIWWEYFNLNATFWFLFEIWNIKRIWCSWLNADPITSCTSYMRKSDENTTIQMVNSAKRRLTMHCIYPLEFPECPKMIVKTCCHWKNKKSSHKPMLVTIQSS